MSENYIENTLKQLHYEHPYNRQIIGEHFKKWKKMKKYFKKWNKPISKVNIYLIREAESINIIIPADLINLIKNYYHCVNEVYRVPVVMHYCYERQWRNIHHFEVLVRNIIYNNQQSHHVFPVKLEYNYDKYNAIQEFIPFLNKCATLFKLNCAVTHEIKKELIPYSSESEIYQSIKVKLSTK